MWSRLGNVRKTDVGIERVLALLSYRSENSYAVRVLVRRCVGLDAVKTDATFSFSAVFYEVLGETHTHIPCLEDVGCCKNGRG